jgi:alcohol dehydrogenase YqhD (iron-dependent ADH family)
VIDPTLFESIPKFQIASGVADMMSHIFERYFSNTEHTELTDALSEATLRTLLTFGPKVVEDPTDYDSWFRLRFLHDCTQQHAGRWQRAGLGLPQAGP